MRAARNQPEFPGTFALLHHVAETVMSEEALSLCMQILGNVQGPLMLHTVEFAALNSFVSGARIASMLLNMHNHEHECTHIDKK